MQQYSGKDGGLYNSIFDRNAADKRYDQMERLIAAQNNNNNNKNNTYYVGGFSNYSKLDSLSIFSFLIYLIVLIYPYVLSYFIIGYLLDTSILLMLLCLCILWVTYLPILTRVVTKLN